MIGVKFSVSQYEGSIFVRGNWISNEAMIIKMNNVNRQHPTANHMCEIRACCLRRLMWKELHWSNKGRGIKQMICKGSNKGGPHPHIYFGNRWNNGKKMKGTHLPLSCWIPKKNRSTRGCQIPRIHFSHKKNILHSFLWVLIFALWSFTFNHFDKSYRIYNARLYLCSCQFALTSPLK